MKAMSVIFAMIGAVASRSKWQTVDVQSTSAPNEQSWVPYKETNEGTKMSFSYFTVNHTDGTQYMNGTVTIDFKDNGWAVPLSDDNANVRLCLAFLDAKAEDKEDTLGVARLMANHYEQIVIDIPNFQKRAAESTVIYKQWYLPSPSFASLYSNGKYKPDLYQKTPKGVCGYLPAQGQENYLKVAENGWEVSDLSYDSDTNVLKLDISRPCLITDPDSIYNSHNFTKSGEYRVMMNWLSLPYECIRKNTDTNVSPRPCPAKPQGNPSGTDGTYGLYRTFGEQNLEQTAAAPVGPQMKILDNAKYIKAFTTLALAVISVYLY